MPVHTNRWLWAAVSVSLLLQVLIIYTPIGRTAFGAVALGIEPWGILLAVLVAGFGAAILTGRLVARHLGPL